MTTQDKINQAIEMIEELYEIRRRPIMHGVVDLCDWFDKKLDKVLDLLDESSIETGIMQDDLCESLQIHPRNMYEKMREVGLSQKDFV